MYIIIIIIIKVKRKTNAVTMKVNTRDQEPALFVVQSTTSAMRTTGSGPTGYVWTRVMYMSITAPTTVATEVTSYPRTAPTPSRLSELCRSFLLLNLKAALFVSE